MTFRLWWKWMAVGCVLAVIGAGAGAAWQIRWWWADSLSSPFKGYLESEILFEIPRGESLAAVALRLERRGVIRSALLMRTAAWLEADRLSIKAGTYRFDRPLSLDAVLDRLDRGEVAYHRITIPEGLDLAQVMALLVEAGIGSVSGYAAVMGRADWISDLDPMARDLEGFLLPDTYHFALDSDEALVVRRMVNSFRTFWNPDRQARARELGLATREAVTLASLVEKETAVPEERSLVSAVFHNRLRLGMRLMCDPTVIYAVRTVKEYDGIIHRSDLQLDSPYNTYLYPGLPPGPIANPGRAALDAALYPSETNYLFFVSRNDGTHQFSVSYEQHSRAVNRYQR